MGINEAVYKIKQLKWVELSNDNDVCMYSAEVPFGSYTACRHRVIATGNWGPWRWGYSFAEDDDHYYDCRDLEAGKKEAWEHWESMLSGALETVAEKG